MVAGDDAQRLNHIKFLINQARDETKGYYHPEVGFNYRMTNIEADLGLAQMDRLRDFLEKKRTFNKIYKEELKDVEIIRFQEEYDNAQSSCWLTCIIFEKDLDIVSLQKKLQEKGIPTRRTYIPVTEFTPYNKYTDTPFTNAKRIYERSLCFPGSTLNSEDDIHYICQILKELI